MSHVKPPRITAENIYTLLQAGSFKDGVSLAKAAEPTEDEEILILAGMCAMNCEQREQAVIFFRRALMIKPNFPQALTNLGVVLQELKRYAEAEDCYRRAISLQPDAHYPLVNLAGLLGGIKRYSEAEECYRQAIMLQPDSPALLFNLGKILIIMKRWHEAENCFYQVISSQPLLTEAFFNLGLVLKEQGHFVEAEKYYRQAVTLEPNSPQLQNNLGELLMTMKCWDAAEVCFRKAMSFSPVFLGAQYNLGFMLLSLGRFTEGLPAYELRFHPDLSLSDPNSLQLKFPLWQGQNLLGKKIVVCAEQGYGDQIQFCRYCNELKRLGAAKVTLICHAALSVLFQSLTQVDVLLKMEDAADLEYHDYWVRIVSLPLYCGTLVETIPAELPYLRSPIDRIDKWSRRLPNGGILVGLFWKGSGANPNDQNRSLPSLQLLAPLWKVPDVNFISLQKGPGEEELITLSADQPILAFGAEIKDFADTAAIITQLDLVITVCSSVAHLAGALNKPCWVMLPAIKPCWRWLQDRNDSPWYPGMLRLFRRELAEDWSVVVTDIALALTELSREQHERSFLSGGQAENKAFVLDIVSEVLLPSNQGIDSKQDKLAQAQALYLRGQYQEVLESLGEVTLLQSSQVELLNLAAICASITGQTNKAELFLQRAIALKPDLPDTYSNLGNLYKELQRPNEAEACYRQALVLQPNSAELLVNLGEFLLTKNRWQEAEICLRQAMSVKPLLLGALHNLGVVMQKSHRYAEAEAYYHQAIAIDPEQPYSLNNLGELLISQRRWEEAETCLRRSMACTPLLIVAHYNLGLLLMAHGRYIEGWPYYELRYHPEFTEPDPATLTFASPVWQGESLQGKSIVVCPEQGFGDQIQFCRYCAELKRLGAARVTLVCEAMLKDLFKSLSGIDHLLSKEEALVNLEYHDYWVRLLSLPLYCGTRLETIPASLPYLQVPVGLMSKWSRRLPSNGLRVGLVWKGAGHQKNDCYRSIPGFRLLAPFWRIPGITFISLQKGQGEEDAITPPNDQPILALGGLIQDFADAAAVISQLDLVITVCTSSAHLAGALNKPCWVMLPAVSPCWRWLQDRNDSPWYPGVMRLFRRKVEEDWSTVVNDVALALADWSSMDQSQEGFNRKSLKPKGFFSRFNSLFDIH